MASSPQVVLRLRWGGVSAGATDGSGTVETVVEGSPRPTGGGLLLERGESVGRYVIIERVGAGGMGIVYSAFDPELDRKIALKWLHKDDSGSVSRSDGRSRLIREAQAMARL